jgi:hypothetical protein
LKKKQFKGLLLKRIDPSTAPARGLRLALALPPDQEDTAAHVQEEEAARWAAFDEIFGLNTAAPDITVQRVITLIECDTGVNPDDPLWVDHVAAVFARRHIPGFSMVRAGSKRHGAPVEWTAQKLAELIADVEFLRKKTGKSVKEICRSLPRQKVYSKRWGLYSGEVLRKAHAKAKKLSRGLLFQFEFFGAEAALAAHGIDPIDAAIKRHALKV